MILPADGDTTEGPLDSVRVQRDLRVFEEPHQPRPQPARVRDGLPQCRARQCPLRHQPSSDPVDHRLRLLRSQGGEHGQPLLGARPLGLRLDRVELPDPVEDLAGLGVVGLRLDELPPHMRPAVREGQVRTFAFPCQRVVSLVAIAQGHARGVFASN